MPDVLTVQLAQVVPCTEAEGPGKRFAIWFQGCPLRCPGCCNPEFLPFRGGRSTPIAELAQWIARTRDTEAIEGITLLGGEPFAHAVGAAVLARTARDLDLSVMVFSGYTIEELRQHTVPGTDELLHLADILVDGPYDRDRPDTTRRWVGSTNQRIHFLTPRYSFDGEWRKRNTLEIRVIGNELTLNGFPARDAVGFWKGWKRKPHPPGPPAPPRTGEITGPRGNDTR